jgi:release factor glutamine methyltransferase
VIENISTKTFRFNKFIIEIHPEVYEPAEDSFLLIEALKINPGDRVLEIGTGCGLIALDCAQRGADVICTDVNPHAIKLVRRNSKRNHHLLKGTIEIREGDLFSVIKDNELFNVIVFNPPYLPISKKERIGGWFDKATDGGKDGIEVTKQFIKGLNKYLLKNGSAYFIFSSLSNRPKLEGYLTKKGFNYEIVASQKFDFESIDIYRITPTD